MATPEVDRGLALADPRGLAAVQARGSPASPRMDGVRLADEDLDQVYRAMRRGTAAAVAPDPALLRTARADLQRRLGDGEIGLAAFNRGWRVLDRPMILSAATPDMARLVRARDVLADFGSLWRDVAVPDVLREGAATEILERLEVRGSELVAVHPRPNENAWLFGWVNREKLELVGARGFAPSCLTLARWSDLCVNPEHPLTHEAPNEINRIASGPPPPGARHTSSGNATRLTTLIDFGERPVDRVDIEQLNDDNPAVVAAAYVRLLRQSLFLSVGNSRHSYPLHGPRGPSTCRRGTDKTQDTGPGLPPIPRCKFACLGPEPPPRTLRR
jgi:hypothetical protein